MIRVTVTDPETGEKLDEAIVVDGDYLLLCSPPCDLASTQAYPLLRKHVLTITGHAPDRSQLPASTDDPAPPTGDEIDSAAEQPRTLQDGVT